MPKVGRAGEKRPCAQGVLEDTADFGVVACVVNDAAYAHLGNQQLNLLVFLPSDDRSLCPVAT